MDVTVVRLFDPNNEEDAGDAGEFLFSNYEAAKELIELASGWGWSSVSYTGEVLDTPEIALNEIKSWQGWLELPEPNV